MIRADILPTDTRIISVPLSDDLDGLRQSPRRCLDSNLDGLRDQGYNDMKQVHTLFHLVILEAANMHLGSIRQRNMIAQQNKKTYRQLPHVDSTLRGAAGVSGYMGGYAIQVDRVDEHLRTSGRRYLISKAEKY